MGLGQTQMHSMFRTSFLGWISWTRSRLIKNMMPLEVVLLLLELDNLLLFCPFALNKNML